MRFKLAFIWIIFLWINDSAAQHWRFAQQFGSPTGFTVITSVAKYGEDQILSAGHYNTPQFSSGGYTVDNAGRDDVLLMLTDQQGQTLWAGGFGGAWEEVPSNVAADANGNFFVAGQFRSISMQVGNDSLVNLGDADGFLVKYRADRSIAWAKRIATPFTDKITGLATDSKGRIWVAGQHTNTSVSPSKKTVYLMQMDADGNIVWTREGSPVTGDLQAAMIAIDAQDNGYFSTNIAGTAVFGATDTVNGCASFNGGLIIKFNENGTFSGSICDSNLYETKGLHVAQNHLYITGVRIIQLDDGQEGYRNNLKSYTAKYTTTLMPIWGRTASTLSDRKALETPVAIAADEKGNVYVNGIYYADTMDFAGTHLINPKYEGWNYPDLFLLKYSSDGEEIRGQSYGGDITDMCTGLLVWGNDHLLMAGAYHSDSLVFGDEVIVHPAEKFSYTAHGTTIYLRNYYSWIAYAKPISTQTNVQQASLLLYPNPTNNTLYLQSEAFTGQPVQVQIFSVDGKLVQQQNINGAQQTFQIQTGNLPPGMYVVGVNSQGLKANQIFIKQ